MGSALERHTEERDLPVIHERARELGRRRRSRAGVGAEAEFVKSFSAAGSQVLHIVIVHG